VSGERHTFRGQVYYCPDNQWRVVYDRRRVAAVFQFSSDVPTYSRRSSTTPAPGMRSSRILIERLKGILDRREPN